MVGFDGFKAGLITLVPALNAAVSLQEQRQVLGQGVSAVAVHGILVGFHAVKEIVCGNQITVFIANLTLHCIGTITGIGSSQVDGIINQVSINDGTSGGVQMIETILAHNNSLRNGDIHILIGLAITQNGAVGTIGGMDIHIILVDDCLGDIGLAGLFDGHGNRFRACNANHDTLTHAGTLPGEGEGHFLGGFGAEQSPVANLIAKGNSKGISTCLRRSEIKQGILRILHHRQLIDADDQSNVGVQELLNNRARAQIASLKGQLIGHITIALTPAGLIIAPHFDRIGLTSENIVGFTPVVIAGDTQGRRAIGKGKDKGPAGLRSSHINRQLAILGSGPVNDMGLSRDAQHGVGIGHQANSAFFNSNHFRRRNIVQGNIGIAHGGSGYGQNCQRHSQADQHADQPLACKLHSEFLLM